MCTNSIIKYQFADTSLSFHKPQHCISNEGSCGMFEKVTMYRWEISATGNIPWTIGWVAEKADKYKYLYKMDTESAYDWLQVWVNANHPSF